MRRHNLIKQGSPIKTLGIGALGGLGVGALVDLIMNNKKREAENYRWWKRPLIYALIGSIPGILKAESNYRNSFIDTAGMDNMKGGMDPNLGLLDPLLLSGKELEAKSDVYRGNVDELVGSLSDRILPYSERKKPEESLDDKLSKQASLYKKALGWDTENIPTYAMTNSVLNNQAGMSQSTVNNMTNLFSAARNYTGMPVVSPAQIAGTLANAGVGYATGAVIGKTIGALCGLPPQSYNTIKNMGMYAGMMNTMNNGINKF